MSCIIIIGVLAFLMLAAYRGHSVIIFAPVAAMLAVLLTSPTAVAPMFTGLFMEKMAGFAKLYLPVFVLGAVFGKVIETSGFSKAIVAFAVRAIGGRRAMGAIVLVCAVLTYGGVSLFVVVFAVYPFAAEMFRQGNIPKRLIPGTIALGAFSFTMDAVPGSPQIQNIIPTAFFGTTTWAAPWLGAVGSVFIVTIGMIYLERQRKRAAASGETYGAGHSNEPENALNAPPVSPLIALSPLIVVAVANYAFTIAIPKLYGDSSQTLVTGMTKPIVTVVKDVKAIWAVEGALLLGILTVFAFGFREVVGKFSTASKSAVAGALLASMNTAAEYGFGSVIAALPGFAVIRNGLSHIPNPLVNEAVTITTLAGITGSASGGLGIALASMADQFVAAAHASGLPLEVLHRIASMASGGMDTLPHNGAVITLLAVTGLTHRQSYRDIFAITCIKTASVFFVIGFYYATRIY
jgi:H+/gluconate symporter-like permease